MGCDGRKRFVDKVAVLSGASSGVGRCIAVALAAEGAHVALLGRRKALLEEVAKVCHGVGGKAALFKVDLLEEEEIRGLKDRVIQELGAVDILVHSAGVFARSEFRSASLGELDRQYRCNVRAPYALIQEFLAALVMRRGQVVFLNSTAGLRAGYGISQYAATKHALKALADSLREEVNSDGVRVLSVFLGRTATPMQQMVCEAEGRRFNPEQLIQPEQVADTVVNALAMGREAEITDIMIRPSKKAADP